MLTANAGKPAGTPNADPFFEELQALGYDDGYDAVRRYVRGWNREQIGAKADAYVPLSFAPGEANQFDWSHEIVLINGVTTAVKVAHMPLCHNRMMFVRTYPREAQEMVFDSHERAFTFFKDTCRHGPARSARRFSLGFRFRSAA